MVRGADVSIQHHVDTAPGADHAEPAVGRLAHGFREVLDGGVAVRQPGRRLGDHVRAALQPVHEVHRVGGGFPPQVGERTVEHGGQPPGRVADQVTEASVRNGRLGQHLGAYRLRTDHQVQDESERDWELHKNLSAAIWMASACSEGRHVERHASVTRKTKSVT